MRSSLFERERERFGEIVAIDGEEATVCFEDGTVEQLELDWCSPARGVELFRVGAGVLEISGRCNRPLSGRCRVLLWELLDYPPADAERGIVLREVLLAHFGESTPVRSEKVPGWGCRLSPTAN